MNLRIEGIKRGNKENVKFCKIIQNSAYGKDLMNLEMFVKIVFKNK
jgi:hypothetical protein